MSETLPTGFSIYKRLEDGIYECEPKGFSNCPFWIIASLDLNTKLKNSDLENVRDFKSINGKDGHYTATANGKPIIAIKRTEFRKYFDDEEEYFGIDVPSTEPILEKDREDVARSVNIDYLITPGVRKGRNIVLTPKLNRRTQRDLSPGQSVNLFSLSYEDLTVRKKLQQIIEEDIQPTIPSTISRLKKNKKSLKKSLKKNKKSLKKSKKKSKTSIKCKKTPYAWKSSSIKKSPFRKLERAKNAETKYKAGQSIGFTAISSLKSLGRIPRSDGCYVLGAKYSELKRH